MGEVLKEPGTVDTEQVQEQEKKSAGRKITTIVGIVLCIIFIPLIILNSVLIIRSYINPDEIPSVFGVAPVIVLSGSMEPKFYAGEMIIIQKADPETLQVGDVICYLVPDSGTAVTHRVTKLDRSEEGERLFITQGDDNNIEDRYAVNARFVQGKWTGIHFPGIGNFAMWLQTPVGMIVFIGVPVVLFFLWDLVYRMVVSKKQKGERDRLQEELERLRAQLGEGSGEGPEE